MTESLHSTAQLTSAVEADVTRIMTLRGRVREAARARHGVSLSPMAFLAHATARALAMHPLLNASMDLDAGTVTMHAGVNLGIAVDAPNGLMVPVIRDAHLLGPVSLQQRIADLADRARTKRITADDLAGGTFTITNTGSRGSLFDTPILNSPEVGILATPAIEKRPVVVTAEDGTDRIAIRHRTYLCLTYDHRLIDGADAARFLGDLATLVDSDDWGPEVDELLA
jgi:pyruvate dehydrogenase E2 component (dihydrolipoamide acetyltransferase)